jgi:hypothetical protein
MFFFLDKWTGGKWIEDGMEVGNAISIVIDEEYFGWLLGCCTRMLDCNLMVAEMLHQT